MPSLLGPENLPLTFMIARVNKKNLPKNLPLPHAVTIALCVLYQADHKVSIFIAYCIGPFMAINIAHWAAVR